MESDAVLRAGLRLRPETAPGLGIYALEQRWYALFLDKAVTCGTGGPAGPHASDTEPRRTAQLLTSTRGGPAASGQRGRIVVGQESIVGLWALLPAAPDRFPAAGIPAPTQIPAAG